MTLISEYETQIQHVHVVDDDPSARESLCWLLGTEGIATRDFDSAETLLDSWLDTWRGCLTIDIRMPGKSGLQLQQELRARGNVMPVIILTGHADVPLAIRAMKSGAFDFLEKPYSDDELLSSINAALALDREQGRSAIERSAIRVQFEQLTKREREVMVCVVEGLTNKSIADRLGISEKTVEIHRARVMRKTGSDSLSELVRRSLIAEEPE
ncbi:MAG: response regulator [Gammaproteobacteria bacterium]|nr:response regulator [Gammaproteobacteria bacterium]